MSYRIDKVHAYNGGAFDLAFTLLPEEPLCHLSDPFLNTGRRPAMRVTEALEA